MRKIMQGQQLGPKSRRRVGPSLPAPFGSPKQTKENKKDHFGVAPGMS